MPRLDKKQWRLGHKRPWWQWNVLTLFAALFVLIWAREILSLKLGSAALLCFAVFMTWGLLPAFMNLRYCRQCDSIIPLSHGNFASGLCSACDAAAKQAALDRRLAEENRRRAVQEAVANLATDACPDCHGKLVVVTVLARHGSLLSENIGIDTKVAYYGDADVERKAFAGHHTVLGQIHATKCEACHRIFLYGIPG